jgi:hypothetical protein
VIRFLQHARTLFVGGQENVVRRAVQDLSMQFACRSGADADFMTGLFLEILCEFFRSWQEIASDRDS